MKQKKERSKIQMKIAASALLTILLACSGCFEAGLRISAESAIDSFTPPPSAAPSHSPAPTPVPLDTRGVLYSWKLAQTSENPEAFARVIAERNITTVYQYFNAEFFESADDSFTRDMAALDIDVLYLCGDASWALEENAASLIRAIDRVLLFNLMASHPIAGIALDVEPHAADNYRTRDWYAYAINLRKAYLYARENGLRLVAVIPYWLDSTDESLLDYIVEHCSDEISVMNYGVGKTQENVQGEIAAARKYGKPVNTIYETKLGQGDKYFASYAEIEADYLRIHDSAQYGRLRIAYHHFGDMR